MLVANGGAVMVVIHQVIHITGSSCEDEEAKVHHDQVVALSSTTRAKYQYQARK